MSPYDDPAVSAGEIANYLYSQKPQTMTEDDLADLERQADGSVLDPISGYTLERCELCGSYYPPEDEGYSGLCVDCDHNPDRKQLSLYPN